MSEPVCIETDFATDSLVIKKGDKSCKIPRSMASHQDYEDAVRSSMLRVGCSENDINQMYRFTIDRYHVGFADPRAMQNAYKVRQSFPRSEQDMDAIMIRRVNARLRLKQEKLVRHWKHVAIGAGIVVFAPPVVAAVLRLWWACCAWIAS